MMFFSKARRQRSLVRIVLSLRSLSTTSTTTAMQIAVITGTTRTAGPPRPILGPRVRHLVCRELEERGNSVTILDQLDLTLPLLQKPEFAYSQSQVPVNLRDLQQKLAEADAYVMITPEYNHAPSPALINLLNHFGSSTFSFKPSAIVSYSAGQWGGTRAANALRPILSELGCLPVSAMIHIPNCSSSIAADGTAATDAESWKGYMDRCFSQLEWWGNAALLQRAKIDPFSNSPAFTSDPSQRDTP